MLKNRLLQASSEAARYGNYIYALRGNRHITKYDQDGNEVWTYDPRTTGVAGDGEDLAVDSSGFVYVSINTDSGANEAHKIDPNGNRITRFQGINTTGVERIAVDQNANVYVSASSSIIKFNANGVEAWRYSVNQGYNVTVDTNGNVYTKGVVSGDHYLFKLDSNGDEVWRYKSDSTASNGIFYRVAVDSEGFSYIVGGLYLTKIDPNGEEVWKNTSDLIYGMYSTLVLGDDNFVYIFEVVTGAPGLLHKANAATGVKIWTSNVGEVALSSAINSIYVDPYGFIYAPSRTSSNIGIAKFDPDGTEVWSLYPGSTDSAIALFTVDPGLYPIFF